MELEINIRKVHIQANPDMDLCRATFQQTLKAPILDTKSHKSIANRHKKVSSKYFYDEEKVLGNGFSSKVYHGHEIENQNANYAIKVIDKRRVKKQNLELLKNQVQILRNLDHQNIVKCYEIIQTSVYFYFILEYCEGGDLDSYIKNTPFISEKQAVIIMNNVVAGYKYLLEQKILHRDLKPPNILRKGNFWKITDFGFSIQGKKTYLAEINVGTPSYMSPEALSRSFYSPKSDFFALGVIFYQILFKKVPWCFKNEKQLVQKMSEQELDQSLFSEIDNYQIARFILKCCQPNQRKRISPEQFINYSFSLVSSNEKENHLKILKDCLSTEMVSRTTHRASKASGKSFSSFPSSNISEAKTIKTESNQRAFVRNSILLQRQRAFCNMLYFLLKNNTSFLFIDSEEREVFLMTTYKHLFYELRRLSSSKFNYFNLNRFSSFIHSKYFATHLTNVQKLSALAIKVFQQQIDRKSILSIRIVNKKFGEFSFEKDASASCFQNLKDYLKERILRLHERIELLSQQNQKSDKSQFYCAFQTLIIYHQFVVERCKKSSYEDSLTIDTKMEDQLQKPSLPIVQVYKKTNFSFQDYRNMKKYMKNL